MSVFVSGSVLLFAPPSATISLPLHNRHSLSLSLSTIVTRCRWITVAQAIDSAAAAAATAAACALFLAKAALSLCVLQPCDNVRSLSRAVHRVLTRISAPVKEVIDKKLFQQRTLATTNSSSSSYVRRSHALAYSLTLAAIFAKHRVSFTRRLCRRTCTAVFARNKE